MNEGFKKKFDNTEYRPSILLKKLLASTTIMKRSTGSMNNIFIQVIPVLIIVAFLCILISKNFLN